MLPGPCQGKPCLGKCGTSEAWGKFRAQGAGAWGGGGVEFSGLGFRV